MASARVSVGYDSDSSDSDIRDNYLGGDVNTEGETAEENTRMETSQENTNPGSGITDVMAKILGNTVPQSKKVILARGQTDKEIRRKQKKRKNEADGIKNKKKKKKTKSDEHSSSDWTTDESDEDNRKERHLQMQKKREWNNLGRVKPNILCKEKERMLQKIATSGVVQIFNAVRQQQNTVKEKMSEAGPSVRRRDRVMGSITKKHFLDLLDSTRSKSAAEAKDQTRKTQDDNASEQPGGKWSILRDDYLMNARMKDWDRDSDPDHDDKD